jgi:glycosyltransferase 2 family protein
LGTQVEPIRAVDRNNKVRSWAIIIVTNLISVLCLSWALNGAGLEHIWGEARHMHWDWVVFALVTDVAVYLFHALRWQLLLRPIKKVAFAHCAEAIYVGLFANETIPLRAGELIRCFLLSKSSEIPLSVAFASALIERILDGVWLMLGFFVCLQSETLPGVLVKGGYILGVFILLLGLILAYAMYAKKQSLNRFLGMSWPRWLNTLIEDLHLIGHSRYLYFAFIVSGVYMLAQIIPIYAIVRASDLDVPWMASFLILVLLRLSGVVPQAPSNLGSFQWVTAKTLMMYGLVSAHAKRFSLILWASLTLPLIVAGFVALAIEGVNLSHLHREAAASAKNRQRA